MIPLFDRYPRLARKLSRVSLGDFPTPVANLESLGKQIGSGALYLKNDGLTSTYFGGNKVRKLEFLLADAKQKKASEILTFGFAGSNHAAATALYAKKLGFHPVSVLLHQPRAHYVRKNLLAQHAVGTELVVTDNPLVTTIGEIARRRTRMGKRPYIVPPGGSSPLGTVGYVNAAFELAEQVNAGELPCPDRIYVPLGSLGTAAGLILGLRTAGLKTKVTCVRVVDRTFVNSGTLLQLIARTRNYLRLRDPSFPDVKVAANELDIRHDYFGDGYARFTEKGAHAVRLAQSAGVALEGTYTGKTLASVVDDADSGKLQNQTALFLNTCNAASLDSLIADVDYRELPETLHPYFEEDVQRLDG